MGHGDWRYVKTDVHIIKHGYTNNTDTLSYNYKKVKVNECIR